MRLNEDFIYLISATTYYDLGCSIISQDDDSLSSFEISLIIRVHSTPEIDGQEEAKAKKGNSQNLILR